MKTSPDTVPRRAGRPLSFDRDTALEKAMLAFWRHGYETTSIADLTAAMGISAPSLYAAFGDKKRLFLEAARLYAGDPDVLERAVADAPTALEAARGLMLNAAATFTREGCPAGCLLASSTASGSPAAADVRAAVADLRRQTEARLRMRIERDVQEGVLPPDTAAAPLAGLVMTVVQGMSVLARDGAPRATLAAIVEAALRAWPAALDGDVTPAAPATA